MIRGGLLAVGIWMCAALAAAANYTAVDPAREKQPPIVLQYDAATGAGFEWAALTNPRLLPNKPEAHLRDAALFLQEAVRKMTGVTLDVQSGNDLASGIVLVLRRYAPPELRNDPAVVKALANDGSDIYNDREAFYLRSEERRLIVIANTVAGLVAAIPALCESVGYEVLWVGPNWTHVPRGREKLVFELEYFDRPSYYLRQLVPTSGQFYGAGTIKTNPKLTLSDPRDESVSASHIRWAIGTRNHGHSMAGFPGHAMYFYHKSVVAEMLKTGSRDGFLTADNHLDLDATRPAAAPANASHLWINTDAAGQPGHGKVYLSDGKQWKEQPLLGMSVNADVSTPLVRQIVFEEMKKRAIRHFEESPEDTFVFGTESEDGAGYANLGQWMRPQNRNWYPEYLKGRGVTWPRPYVLHGYQGIDQKDERWDYAFPADVVFAFNNWLLCEFDAWIDSLPDNERVTKAGLAKKELVRCSLYSYALHDVAPHLNLDPRIRVMIAGYPKHRGVAEWKKFATQRDMAAAFKQMLPREPSGEYRIISIAYYADHNLEGIPPRWSAAPTRIVNDLRSTYDAGIRALTCEMDFNGGKYGLAYYLYGKMLWNARLTATELDTLRDRWLQRAYGAGWREMKAYYDFMLVENYPANAPGAWAKAIRLIDSADAKIDPATEPDSQRRLDDLKQYWYFYYLLDTGRDKPDATETSEFAWKGQMSYMNAMHMITQRVWKTRVVSEVVPAALRSGPAHYSPEETATWWQKMHEHWPEIDVTMFSDVKLANGRSGREVDQNDLVRVATFQSLTTGKPLIFNSAQAANTPFLTVAKSGETIGFTFSWPANDEQLRFYGPKDVPYGAEFWDSAKREWTPVVDITTTFAPSQRITAADGKVRHLVEVKLAAPQTGTYRLEVGRGGFLALLAGLSYDTAKGEFSSRTPHTYSTRLNGLTQDPVWIYLPKGTKSLDLEVWDGFNRKQLQLYRGMNEKGLIRTRDVDISSRGTHRVTLEAGEDGNLARISGNGFAFPLLYSVPCLWAKCPAELVIPRAIAEADGLIIVD